MDASVDAGDFDGVGARFGARGASRGGGMDDDAFARDFQAFCKSEENAPLLREHQRQELRKLDRIAHRVDAMDFRDAVLRSNEEAQRNVAPFLRTRALRAVISTFRNDANGDFGKWATNPLVLRMLSEMQTALDEGRASEEEIERFMVNYLSDSKNDGHDAFKKRTTREANLETKDLVGALNEQCELRYKGNAHYERREFAEARECYAQALGIMNLVKGKNPFDADECLKNRAACLRNLGAACMGLKLYGEAIEHLSEYLRASPDDARILCRRGRAFVGRGDFAAAERDFAACLRLDPYDAEPHDELARLRDARRRDRERSRALSRSMFQS